MSCGIHTALVQPFKTFLQDRIAGQPFGITQSLHGQTVSGCAMGDIRNEEDVRFAIQRCYQITDLLQRIAALPASVVTQQNPSIHHVRQAQLIVLKML